MIADTVYNTQYINTNLNLSKLNSHKATEEVRRKGKIA